MRKSFFYVYNPQGEKPKFKHETYSSAFNEAKRLTEQSVNGEEFYVLGAWCVFRAKRVEFEQFDTSDEIPF